MVQNRFTATVFSDVCPSTNSTHFFAVAPRKIVFRFTLWITLFLWQIVFYNCK